MKTIDKITDNPGLYRSLSVPFENAEAAEAALETFSAEMRKLRERLGIADVAIVCQVSCVVSGPTDEAKREGVVLVSGFAGDRSNYLPMLAFAYGQEKSAFSSELSALLKGDRK